MYAWVALVYIWVVLMQSSVNTCVTRLMQSSVNMCVTRLMQSSVSACVTRLMYTWHDGKLDCLLMYTWVALMQWSEVFTRVTRLVYTWRKTWLPCHVYIRRTHVWVVSHMCCGQHCSYTRIYIYIYIEGIYRMAKTHRMPYIAGHFPQKSPIISSQKSH